MLQRRPFILLCAATAAYLAVPLDLQAQSPTNAPSGIVSRIYTNVVKGKGDGGGGFIMADRTAKAKYFSKSVIALWTKADAHTPKGDVGPIDFDLPTNSQDPGVKSYNLVTEKMDNATATITVTMTNNGGPRKNAADDVVRYDFVRDGGHWKIDDIRGAADGAPWSLRGLLRESLKN